MKGEQTEFNKMTNIKIDCSQMNQEEKEQVIQWFNQRFPNGDINRFMKAVNIK